LFSDATHVSNDHFFLFIDAIHGSKTSICFGNAIHLSKTTLFINANHSSGVADCLFLRRAAVHTVHVSRVAAAAGGLVVVIGRRVRVHVSHAALFIEYSHSPLVAAATTAAAFVAEISCAGSKAKAKISCTRFDVKISCAWLIVEMSLARFNDNVPRAKANSMDFVGIVSLFQSLPFWPVEDAWCHTCSFAAAFVGLCIIFSSSPRSFLFFVSIRLSIWSIWLSGTVIVVRCWILANNMAESSGNSLQHAHPGHFFISIQIHK